MRERAAVSVRLAKVGLGALGLVVLTSCIQSVGVIFRILDRGPDPRSSLIFCDIQKNNMGRRCATAEDKAVGIRMAAAAIALNTGQSSTIALDESPAARARCAGEPEAVVFQAAFPDGDPVCLNCSVIGPAPAPYLDSTTVCVERCLEVFEPIQQEPIDPAVRNECRQLTRLSTNMPVDRCFVDACTTTSWGGVRSDFVDPRRDPEPIQWTDLINVTANGNSITKTTGGAMFDAGAASAQWVLSGDSYVEFSANEKTLSHVIGFAAIPVGCAFPCPDTDPSLQDIAFAVSLNRDGRYYVIENGVLITGPNINGSFGDYGVGERFRVFVRDNSDGTASATYMRITGACVPGAPCNENVFFTSTSAPARYPLRIDASFRELNATLADVRIVRIQ